MFALTIDRFAEVYLNLRYPLYWSSKKTKYLMICNWILYFCICTVLTIYVGTVKNGFDDVYLVFGRYVFPVLLSLFSVTVTFTYYYITKKILHSKKQRVRPKVQDGHEGKKSYVMVNVNDLLFPTLLIISFVLLILIPIVVNYLMVSKTIKGGIIQFAIHILFYIGYISDGIIYVLLSTKPGRKIVKKLCCRML